LYSLWFQQANQRAVNRSNGSNSQFPHPAFLEFPGASRVAEHFTKFHNPNYWQFLEKLFSRLGCMGSISERFIPLHSATEIASGEFGVWRFQQSREGRQPGFLWVID
jgi:hypothetical protein